MENIVNVKKVNEESNEDIAHYDISDVMKLNSPEFHAIFTPELKKLFEIFINYGYEIRLVGGAVRDLLDGKKPNDLDFATTATPEQMKNMFEEEKVRLVNKNGEKHGTIVPHFHGVGNFEITTLRTDVTTDGRHAEVEFTTNWEVDAARRDLTVNSMYLSFDGTLYDYFNGYEDLKNRRVVFVGDPESRIREDYLRILRYFRFFGKVAQNPDVHDENTLEAIRSSVLGLANISGERIQTELFRILQGNFVEEIVKKMLDLGLGPYIGLGRNDELDLKYFEKVVKLRSKFTFRPISFIAALLQSEDKVLKLNVRLKLSSADRKLAQFLVRYKSDRKFDLSRDRLKLCQEMLVFSRYEEELRLHLLELLKFKDDEEVLNRIATWPIPIFPITGKILKSKGIKDGKEMGTLLENMKKTWIVNDFQSTTEELLNLLPKTEK